MERMKKIKYGIAVVINTILIGSLIAACTVVPNEMGTGLFILLAIFGLLFYNASFLFMVSYVCRNEKANPSTEFLLILFSLWPMIIFLVKIGLDII